MDVFQRLQSRSDSYNIEEVPGWAAILDELDRNLSEIAPDYKISDVKSKFAGLRFYAYGWPPRVAKQCLDLIRAAEEKSYETCEICGAPGKGWRIGNWLWTLCEADEERMRTRRATRWSSGDDEE